MDIIEYEAIIGGEEVEIPSHYTLSLAANGISFSLACLLIQSSDFADIAGNELLGKLKDVETPANLSLKLIPNDPPRTLSSLFLFDPIPLSLPRDHRRHSGRSREFLLSNPQTFSGSC